MIKAMRVRTHKCACASARGVIETSKVHRSEERSFWLSEAHGDRLQPFCPKFRGKPWVDNRRVLSGIIFVQRNG